MVTIFKNEVEDERKLVEKENNINEFAGRLTKGQYKVILYNNQTPILKDNLGIIELIADDLEDDSKVELQGDCLKVIHDGEAHILTGYKEMTDGEIFARKYLDECEYTGSLIIKDSEMQIEMREDNFKNARDFYKKCKDIVNIRGFFGDETDPIWRMNWDCFWMTYKDGSRELWQRA